MRLVFAVDDGLMSGNANFADIMFLAAFIVFVVAAVLRALAHAVDGFLVAVGLALVSLAWLVL